MVRQNTYRYQVPLEIYAMMLAPNVDTGLSIVKCKIQTLPTGHQLNNEMNVSASMEDLAKHLQLLMKLLVDKCLVAVTKRRNDMIEGV